ncbi:MAG: S-layer homology domain-containing protein, partial [Neglectibacter timonensis]
MAKVEIGADVYDPADTEAVYDLTDPVTITVTSEDKNTVNVYTLTAKVAAQFSDVKEGAWYYDYVTEAAAAGIINGKGNGIFDPEGNITRGDFALMTVRMLGVDVSGYTTAPFSDVKASDYYMQAIAYCAEKGIIGGTGDGKFEPEKNILREEAAKIIAIALNLDGTTTEKFKDDAKISNWAKGYVDACKAAGIFGGDEK